MTEQEKGKYMAIVPCFDLDSAGALDYWEDSNPEEEAELDAVVKYFDSAKDAVKYVFKTLDDRFWMLEQVADDGRPSDMWSELYEVVDLTGEKPILARIYATLIWYHDQAIYDFWSDSNLAPVDAGCPLSVELFKAMAKEYTALLDFDWESHPEAQYVQGIDEAIRDSNGERSFYGGMLELAKAGKVPGVLSVEQVTKCDVEPITLTKVSFEKTAKKIL